ncbi:hypothetical protein FACS189447_03570 [Spirochaetia bacterium]|nr:hypothetical protein FACS189447_03570 [Spirochaetia bacterium]
MRKSLILFALLIIAAGVGAQTHTYQGLPWGSTPDQVIAKLGRPTSRENITPEDDYTKSLGYSEVLVYENVRLSGYKTDLIISFGRGMGEVFYNITEKDLNILQKIVVFNDLMRLLIKRYGDPARARIPRSPEVMTDRKYLEEGLYYAIWHFPNFHIFIDLDPYLFSIGYYTDAGWNLFYPMMIEDYPGIFEEEREFGL